MKVLLAIARTDYGRPNAGDSYEYVAFHDPLIDMGHEVEVFDTCGDGWRGDPAATGSALMQSFEEFKPDMLMCMTMEYEMPADVLLAIGKSIQTVNWFVDDTWRFKRYSRHLATAFTHVFTTSREAERNYKSIGVSAAFLPLGFNSRVFHPTEGGEEHDVTFMGQPYGRRGKFIQHLRDQGIDVYARGNGWPDGRLETDEICQFMSSSKINLSFLEGSVGRLYGHGLSFRGVGRLDNLLRPVLPPRLQLKGRLFEIPACGGFQLTGKIPVEATECFEPGKELVVVERDANFAKTIRYYLSHPEERIRIAEAGKERAWRDHTFQRRFETIFRATGLMV